jgi:predicted secreted hydrolase
MRARLLWGVLLGTLAACGETPRQDPAETPAGNTGLRYLGGGVDAGFARATVPRELVFPADHGSHPEFRTEWWYFTGNLATVEQRHFGFELTFFRYGVAPAAPPAPTDSAWRTDQAWMAHFAITDTAGGRFVARERLARGALGLAGATASPLRVWVEDWWVAGDDVDGKLSLRLEAQDDTLALRLDLRSLLPPVAHGEQGLDRKGASAGNASYYYSVPRLEAEGSIAIEGESHRVEGLAWLDREWGTSTLEAGVVGWDWFALHISDGTSLMFYRLRTAGGGTSPFSSGSLVGRDGSRTALAASDVSLAPLAHWTSSATGARYPIAWQLNVPSAGLALELRPRLEAQEVNLSVRYWEGAMLGAGVGPNGRVSAEGYLELAGY